MRCRVRGYVSKAAAGVATVIALASCGTTPAPMSESARTEDCTSRGNLGFLCGVRRPEDVVRVPGTRWLIYSGFHDGEGLKLVDSAARSMRSLVIEPVDPSAVSAWSQCSSPPDLATFNTQGLSIRHRSEFESTLHVVNHGGRESIEVFSIDARAALPRLTWNGCVLMPAGLAANSVATFSDGTILASVLTHPGRTITDFWRGETTGGVYAWSPGEATFRLLAGTELPGNNGIETSPDDAEFYVVAFGWRSVVVFSRADTTKPLRRALAPGFMPDNIHRVDGRLLLAGMQFDEPACGGVRKIIDGKADDMRCHRGYVVAELEPRSMSFSVVSYAEPDPDFNGVSAATIVSDQLWLASYQSSRIAWRMAPISKPSLAQ